MLYSIAAISHLFIGRFDEFLSFVANLPITVISGKPRVDLRFRPRCAMSISALSNPGLLSFASNANLLTPSSSGATVQIDQGHIQLLAMVNAAQASSASSSSTAQLAADTYTPSTQSTQTSSSQSTQPSSRSAVPWATPGISDAEALKMFASGASDPMAVAWGSLTKDIAAGDISSAQTDLTTYQQALTNSNIGMSTLTAASGQFMSDLATLGSALQQGDLSKAQSAFATAGQDRPQDLGAALDSALGAIELDGQGTVNAVVNSYATGASYIANSDGKLSTDIANYDGLAREAATGLEEQLVSQGFSATDSWVFADGEFSLSNFTGSTNATQNAAFDATRTAQWVQALTSFAKDAFSTGLSKASSGFYNNDGTMINLFQSVESMASISAAKQTQTLVQSTLGAGSTTTAGGGSATGAWVSIDA